MENEEKYFSNFLNDKANEQETRQVQQWTLLLLDRYVSGQANLQERQIMDACYYQSVEGIIWADKDICEEDRVVVWKQVIAAIPQAGNDARRQQVYNWQWIWRAALFIGFIALASVLGMYWDRANKEGHYTAVDKTPLHQLSTLGFITTTSLPDGSAITLNRNTELSYDQQTFNQKGRYVSLKKGEAFFEVVKNDQKPFVVTMEPIQVVVVGTSFNLKIYEAAKRKSITVGTGKVDILINNKKMATLLPDEMLEYDNLTNTYKISRQNSGGVKSWMNGDIVFINCGAKEISEQIYQYYKVRVILDDDLVFSKAKFNSVFPKGASLETIANSLASIYALSYRMTADKLIFFKKNENTARKNN